MMTKNELEKYLENRSWCNLASTEPFPSCYSFIEFDNVKDAFQIKSEHRAALNNICAEIRHGFGIVIMFNDRAELYDRDEYVASSNDTTEIGEKLKMAHDAYKTAPREKGMPEEMSEWFRDAKDTLKKTCFRFTNKEDVESLFTYMEHYGVPWVDEARILVYGEESKLVDTKESKKELEENNILNTSDGYIVIDTPVKIFRSQAAMESYRREHKEENTPALFVKDGEILCLQETKPQEETKPTIDDVMKKETGVNFWRVCKASGKR